MTISTDTPAVAAARARLDAIRQVQPANGDPGIDEWTRVADAAREALQEAMAAAPLLPFVERARAARPPRTTALYRSPLAGDATAVLR